MSRDGASRFTADTLDTAVVGAGVGGLYTTWRLLACGQPPDGIGVFEASERVGGRLFSVSKPGTPGIAAEFGEMRFLASHTLITSIATKFDLATREFPAGGPENILCFATKKALADGMQALPDSVAAAVKSDPPLRKEFSERQNLHLGKYGRSHGSNQQSLGDRKDTRLLDHATTVEVLGHRRGTCSSGARLLRVLPL
jgi:monoamine oxidase